MLIPCLPRFGLVVALDMLFIVLAVESFTTEGRKNNYYDGDDEIIQ